MTVARSVLGAAAGSWLPALVSLLVHVLIFYCLAKIPRPVRREPPRILHMVLDLRSSAGDPGKPPGPPGGGGGGGKESLGEKMMAEAPKAPPAPVATPKQTPAPAPVPVATPAPRPVSTPVPKIKHVVNKATVRPRPTPAPVKRHRKPKAVPRPAPVAAAVDMDRPLRSRPAPRPARGIASASGIRAPAGARAGGGGPGGRPGRPGGHGGPGGGRGPGGGGGGGSSGAHLVGFQRPPYPADARSRNEEGKVVLEVQVSAAGRAVEVNVAQSSGYASLDRAATNGVRRAHFQPARQGGIPVDGRTRVTVVFRLDS